MVSWINVQELKNDASGAPYGGAKGDGVTDDRAAIMSALNQLSEGGTLYFPPAVYISSGPIYIANKSNFVLLGYGATIKVVDKYKKYKYLWNDDPEKQYPNAGDRTSDPRFFSNLEIFNCDDWRVIGLTLDGNYNNRGKAPETEAGTIYGWNHGIHIAGCHRFTIQSVEARYCQGEGIVINPIYYDDESTPPRFPARRNKNRTIARTDASNCSDFALIDIKAHHIAASSIHFGGARNGTLDGLIDYEIGTDRDNSIYGQGGNSGVHFESDDPSVGVCEWITVSNVSCRNHAFTSEALFDLSSNVRHVHVSNFHYQHSVEPNGAKPLWTNAPGSVWKIITIAGQVSGAHDITLSNGEIHIDPSVLPVLRDETINAHNRKVECCGVLLEEGARDATIQGITIDGVDIGILCGRTTKDIRIKGNLIRNTGQYSLWLNGQCSVEENMLLDVTGDHVGWGAACFIHVGDHGSDDSQPFIPVTDVIACENNVLRYTLDGKPGPTAYFLLDCNVTGFSANRNQCYGMNPAVLDKNGISRSVPQGSAAALSIPISFLENKFGKSPNLVDTPDGFSGSFLWPTEATVLVSNSNITPYTAVLIFPQNVQAIQLMQDIKFQIPPGAVIPEAATLNPYDSFVVAAINNVKGKGTELFGYVLSQKSKAPLSAAYPTFGEPAIYDPLWWVKTHGGVGPGPGPGPDWLREFVTVLVLAGTANKVSPKLRTRVLELVLQQVSITTTTIKKEIKKLGKK
jgi:hypothetical protein